MSHEADEPGSPRLGARDALAIMTDARQRARHELSASQSVLFATWGIAFLVSYGAVWLSVRGQRPYAGPGTAAIVTVFMVGAAAIAVTVVLIGRAASGVGGWSALQRRILLLSYVARYLAMFALEGALAEAGASRAVIGVFGAAAPLLVIGLACAAGSALRLSWPVFGIGVWLVVVAAASGYAGPAGVWGVDALAAGLAFLVMAGIRKVRAW